MKAAKASHTAVLHGGVLQYGDGREGLLGDVSFHPGAVEMGVLGPTTDPLLEGRSAQMPPAGRGPLDRAPGAQALVAVTRAGPARLAALPESVLRPVAARLAPPSQPIALSPRPCPLGPRTSATSRSRSTTAGALPHITAAARGYGITSPRTSRPSQFWRRAQQVLAEAGAPAAGVGAHSFRRGGGGRAGPRRSDPAHALLGPSARLGLGAPHKAICVSGPSLPGDCRRHARRRPHEPFGGPYCPRTPRRRPRTRSRWAQHVAWSHRGAARPPSQWLPRLRGLRGRPVLDRGGPAPVGGAPPHARS